jgi:hypothetical protein
LGCGRVVWTEKIGQKGSTVKFIKRFFKRVALRRMAEADLNKESANAAAFYTRKQGPHVPLGEKINMTNYCAHGFFMGVRWHEEQLLGERDGK